MNTTYKTRFFAQAGAIALTLTMLLDSSPTFAAKKGGGTGGGGSGGGGGTRSSGVERFSGNGGEIRIDLSVTGKADGRELKYVLDSYNISRGRTG